MKKGKRKSFAVPAGETLRRDANKPIAVLHALQFFMSFPLGFQESQSPSGIRPKSDGPSYRTALVTPR